MHGPSLICVITSIQPPTASVRALCQSLAAAGARLIVMGDKKGPDAYDLLQADLFTLARQQHMGFKLAAALPTGHYTRKNLGYLEAIRRGAQCIYETDDDNMPTAGWRPRSLRVCARQAPAKPWLNVYRFFCDNLIWPRGFPLELVRQADTAPVAGLAEAGTAASATPPTDVDCPIQQALVNGSPDVDAVWRLILERDFRFDDRPSLWLPPGTVCPFNSQSTWWWPAAYPLLYLPSFCSFRMTDIWRSFIAQRCLWELDHGLVFHAPEAVQDRNAHNLLRDFKDEVPGYLSNAMIVDNLRTLRLQPGPKSVLPNLLRCYEQLVSAGVFPKDELDLVGAWEEDIQSMQPQRPELTGREVETSRTQCDIDGWYKASTENTKGTENTEKK